MDWHRLFGLILTDYFTNSPYEVEMEKDLSLHQQFLDVVISAEPKQVQYGREHFQQRSPYTSTLIQDLLSNYQQEGIPMPYTMEDFVRETKEKFLKASPHRNDWRASRPKNG